MSTQISKTKYDELANRFKNFRASIKEHTERGSVVIQGAILTAGGGVVAALLDTKMPEMPVVGGDSKLFVGGALVAAALLDVAGDYGEQMTELGSGILAVYAHDQAKKALAK